MACYPALDVRGVDDEYLLALVDDFGPIAAQTDDDGASSFVTVFFPTVAHRDDAARAVRQRIPLASVTSRDVDDEGWAARSQAALRPITVGRITVTPPWALEALAATRPGAPDDGGALAVVIEPSMGFGTGHHASTRLCLAALQAIDLGGRSVLDVGTGSGVLALAAHRLGARAALGIDSDPDALQSANENHVVNGRPAAVAFRLADLDATDLPPSDVVVANLTGALLVRQAARLTAAVCRGGRLIVSGLMTPERPAVLAAFPSLAVRWEAGEDEWVGLMLSRRDG